MLTVPSWFDWLTLVAIVMGPIAAVFVTRVVDAQRAADGRRQDIFKTLMRTRRNNTSPEHVGALNLIELEFVGHETVLARWRELYQHFGTEHVRRPSERTEDAPDDAERARRTEAFQTRLFDERQKLLAKLLHAMAKVLKFKLEQLEIFEGGYLPQGWVDVDSEQRTIRQYVVDLAHARRLVPVGVLDYATARAPDTAEPEQVSDVPKAAGSGDA